MSWKCPNCGEQLEDQFDSCWKCATAKGSVTGEPRAECKPESSGALGAAAPQPAPETTPPDPSRPRGGSGFFRSWSRGWFILFLCWMMGLCFRFVSGLMDYALRLTREGRESRAELFALAVLVFAVLALPTLAYFGFVAVFGEGAWPFGKRARQGVSLEEAASDMLTAARGLEARGLVADAEAAHREILATYPRTAAAREAHGWLRSRPAQARGRNS